MVAKAKIKRFEVEKITETLDFEVGEEVFHAKPKLSGIALLNFVRGISKTKEVQEDGSEAGNSEILDLLLSMLKDALGPKEYRRFEDYTSSDDIYVPIETIMEIVQYLIEEYTQSPTEAS